MPDPTWGWLESVTNTAKLLRVTPQAVRKAIKEHRLSARKIGHAWVVDIRRVGEAKEGG